MKSTRGETSKGNSAGAIKVSQENTGKRRVRTALIGKVAGVTLPVSFGGEYFFKKNDPATNCHREYTLSCQRTLWAAFCVRRSWGRQGSKRPRSLMQEFEDEATALKYLRWAVARRLRRGYRLVEYRPAEPGNSFTSEG